MKSKIFLSALVAVIAIFSSSCTSAYYASGRSGDELYGNSAYARNRTVANDNVYVTNNENTYSNQISDVDIDNYVPGSFAAALGESDVLIAENDEQATRSGETTYYEEEEGDSTIIVNIISPSWSYGTWDRWGYYPSWGYYSSWYNPWRSPWHYRPMFAYSSWFYDPWFYDPWFSFGYYYPSYYRPNRPIYRPDYAYRPVNRQPTRTGSSYYATKSQSSSGTRSASSRRENTLASSSSNTRSSGSNSRYFDSKGDAKTTASATKTYSRTPSSVKVSSNSSSSNKVQGTRTPTNRTSTNRTSTSTSSKTSTSSSSSTPRTYTRTSTSSTSTRSTTSSSSYRSSASSSAARSGSASSSSRSSSSAGRR